MANATEFPLGTAVTEDFDSGDINCTVVYTINATDQAAGVVASQNVTAAFGNDSVITVIEPLALPSVPVYTGSVVESGGAALAAGETKFVTGGYMTAFTAHVVMAHVACDKHCNIYTHQYGRVYSLS
jgi:hypothetical protein